MSQVDVKKLEPTEAPHIADDELYALAGMSSASSAMFERRRRILKEAQRMLAEDGVAGFSTMELGRRSGVAQRTIYNAFGNRDTLIAIVIRFYFEQFSLAIADKFDTSTLDGALGRLAATTMRNVQLRNYMSAIVSLHFLPSAPAPVRAVTLKIGAGFFLEWLHHLQETRQLPAHCDLQRLTRSLANLQYAVVQDWLVGAIQEDRLVFETLEAVLQMLSGALGGKARALIDGYLTDLHQSGPRTSALLRVAAEEVTALFGTLQELDAEPNNQ
jgi:AcrR family transcriptional regulator